MPPIFSLPTRSPSYFSLQWRCMWQPLMPIDPKCLSGQPRYFLVGTRMAKFAQRVRFQMGVRKARRAISRRRKRGPDIGRTSPGAKGGFGRLGPCVSKPVASASGHQKKPFSSCSRRVDRAFRRHMPLLSGTTARSGGATSPHRSREIRSGELREK
jgi:hypothetical protein